MSKDTQLSPQAEALPLPPGASAGVDAPTTRVVQGVCERCNRDAYLAVDAFGMRCWRCDLDHYRSALAAERAAGAADTARLDYLERTKKWVSFGKDCVGEPAWWAVAFGQSHYANAPTLRAAIDGAIASTDAARARAADRETEE